VDPLGDFLRGSDLGNPGGLPLGKPQREPLVDPPGGQHVEEISWGTIPGEPHWETPLVEPPVGQLLRHTPGRPPPGRHSAGHPWEFPLVDHSGADSAANKPDGNTW
jgi:hypothetical protein